MKSKVCFVLLLILIVTALSFCQTEEAKSVDKEKIAPPNISIANDVGKTVKKEVSQVGEHLQVKAQSLFAHTPSGWDQKTIQTILSWLKNLPMMVPEFIKYAIEQGKILGYVGSAIILAFLFSIIYSLIISKRLLRKVEGYYKPLKQRMSERYYLYLISISKILISSLFPLFLLLIFWVIKSSIEFRLNWFLLIGNLLWLWTLGALILSFLRESLFSEISRIPSFYGKTIFRLTRIVVVYVLIAVAVYTSAKAVNLPDDILAFIRFIISLTIVCSFLIPLNRKKALLSMLPELPYKSYKIFVDSLNRYYFTSILLTFFVGIMWCFGFKRFATVILTKTWAVAGVYLLIMLVYHYSSKGITSWSQRKVSKGEEEDDNRAFLFKKFKSILNFLTFLALVTSTLYLFGLSDSIIKLLSFTILTVGETHFSIWSFLTIIFIIFAFIYFSYILRAFLDYKFFPFFNIDTGVAYAINAFINYFLISIGFFTALIYIGFDFKLLMVFAGAIGIGIGLGLQKTAANLISGFLLLFGQRLRKDDWIQVSDTIGVVTEISLRATKVKTRDNIEYIIPNEQFISNTFINYTLSSPMIRTSIPVGVSYNSDPAMIKNLLIKAAEKHHEVVHYKKPDVFFKEYGDNAIVFDLLVWFDIRKVSERMIRSKLYFTIFDDLKAAGIEIPFPQRDIHLKSGFNNKDITT
jgi:small-conductance mechanosensitive channel